jgi:inorganic phosphate transporter, PiT family
MELFGEHLALGTGIFLILALLMALSFEFVNGFHDTANAVATVIYTHSLRPVVAVVWSGFCNLMGVLTSSWHRRVVTGGTCSKRRIRGGFRHGLRC